MDNKMTRRGFVAGTVVAAGAAIACLAGCAAESDDDTNQEASESQDWSNTTLPLGSVVTLGGSENLGVKFMVVSRRPNVATVANDDGTRSELERVFDYAAVQWPIGFVSDLTLQAQGAECIGFYRENISSVDFIGCEDDRESEAKALLDAAYGTSDDCSTILLPMQQDIVSRFPENGEG